MYAEVNGVKLFYQTMGSGPPLMCMHGGLGADHSSYIPQFLELTDQWTLILYDHRGNGRSRPIEWEGVTHETWAADADALREYLGYEKMSLLGHSYGGFLAQEYAARYQERLDALILLCTAPAWDYGEVIEANARARAKTPETLAAVEEALTEEPVAEDEDFQRILKLMAPLYFHRPEEFPEFVEAFLQDTIFSAAAWNHCSSVCLPEFNMMAELPKIQVPTLVLSGIDDWITPAEQGRRIHEALPNSELVIFEKSGHVPNIEENELFFRTLREWLSKHSH